MSLLFISKSSSLSWCKKRKSNAWFPLWFYTTMTSNCNDMKLSSSSFLYQKNLYLLAHLDLDKKSSTRSYPFFFSFLHIFITILSNQLKNMTIFFTLWIRLIQYFRFSSFYGSKYFDCDKILLYILYFFIYNHNFVIRKLGIYNIFYYHYYNYT